MPPSRGTFFFWIPVILSFLAVYLFGPISSITSDENDLRNNAQISLNSTKSKAVVNAANYTQDCSDQVVENIILTVNDLQTESNSENHRLSLVTPVNATFYTLCRNSDLYDMMETVQNYQDRFNNKFHYDWVFLNDMPFTDEFIDKITNLITGNAKFGLIPKEHWSIPETVNRTKMYENMNSMMNDPDGIIPYANSLSYRNMCRFQSGFFYKHELLLNYDYFWRVEPGVKLYCDINDDLFNQMESNDYKYGFTISTIEYPKTIKSLFKTFKDYLITSDKFDSLMISNQTNHKDFIYDVSKNDYNLCHFWTNFEIGNLNFFRSSMYNEMFNYLDETNGFFYERWGDAPIRSLILSSLLNKGQIKWFDQLGYLHQPYLQCPTDPNIHSKNKCSCDPEEDFTNSWYSCTWFFNKIVNQN